MEHAQSLANVVVQSIEHAVASSCDGRDKTNVPVRDESPRDLYTVGDGKLLPTRLVEMWTEIDPALPREDIQSIIQTTFAAFRPSVGSEPQPWMNADDKSSVIAIEKARITNGGKIPASWKATAEQSEHGRKWLEINQGQEQAEALARARETWEKALADARVAQVKTKKAASLYYETLCSVDHARKDARSADSQAKAAAKLAAEAKATADRACEEQAEARRGLRDSRLALREAEAHAKSANLAYERIERAAKVVPQGKKRKLEG
ncbi:hypothetical protein N0V82_004585 [Gnomoniopsis sp. IMI 355080]|nr:hypothetical protein N0V82_004585 [Gnomoniopsis sp. IMI 355080]